MNARRGLKRLGLGAYVVRGPAGAYLIHRQRWPQRYFVRRDGLADFPVDIFSIEFRRLGPARRYAEEQAGVSV